MKHERKHDPAFFALLGKRIQEVRKFKGVSQRELAERCSIHITSFSRIEKGKGNPTILTLRMIAYALNVHLRDVIPEV